MYNCRNSIEDTISSLLNQTYVNIEVICIDDGSRVSYDDILYRFKDERLFYFKQENMGAAGARNTGIIKSNGAYIAFCDADDRWHAEKLEKQLSFLTCDVSIVGCLTDSNASVFHKFATNPISTITKHKQLLSNFFQTSTVVISRKTIEEIGMFPVDRRYAEEGDLFFRALELKNGLVLNQILVSYSNQKASFGQSGLSANLNFMWYGELRNYLNYFERNNSSILLLITLFLYSGAKFLVRKLRVFMRGKL